MKKKIKNSPWVKIKPQTKIRKYFHLNENKDKSNLWDAAKQCLDKNF